jgi:hypothetical protein
VHVGALVPVPGVTAQVSATLPVKPATGVTVTVPVALPPSTVARLPLLASVKPAVPPFEIVNVPNEG